MLAPAKWLPLNTLVPGLPPAREGPAMSRSLASRWLWPTSWVLLTTFLAGCGGGGSAVTAPPPGPGPSSSDSGAVVLGDLSGVGLFPAGDPWTVDVSAAPVDTASQQFIDFLSGRTPSNPGATRSLHPDFGPPPYGIPYVVVAGTQPLEPVTFTLYGSQSDDGAPGRPAGYPIPIAARTSAGWIEGNVAGGGTSGDRHLLIVDRDRGLLFETWATRWNGSLGRWEAGSGATWDLAAQPSRPDGWTSADAAGLAILPGLVRFDETGGEIRHAFRFTARATNGRVWPATHSAGSTSGAPPMGLRLRLKPGVDLSVYTPEVRRVFQAMKTYGLVLADNGSDLYVTGTMDARWDNDVLNPAFASLTADDFDVIERGWRPAAAPARAARP